jgi:hypothetical protein
MITIKCKSLETVKLYNILFLICCIIVWLILTSFISCATGITAISILNYGSVIGVLFVLLRIIFDKSMKDGSVEYMIGAIWFGISIIMYYVINKFIQYEIVKQGEKDGN